MECLVKYQVVGQNLSDKFVFEGALKRGESEPEMAASNQNVRVPKSFQVCLFETFCWFTSDTHLPNFMLRRETGFQCRIVM